MVFLNHLLFLRIDVQHLNVEVPFVANRVSLESIKNLFQGTSYDVINVKFTFD
jgi:hypothetical protein